MLSVIVPAHNEEAVIGRLLRSLTNGAQPGELEIIVVANGCHDRTAELARAFGGAVRVIETAKPSKSHALNLGDHAASGFPRFYVDADVTLALEAVRSTVEALEHRACLAAAPTMKVDLSDRNWFVRAFYDVWTRLPYCKSGMVGAGVYALSEAGRRRFGEFPAIIADDGFARLHFTANERVTIPTCHFVVTPPKTLWGIIKIKARAHFGNLELQAKFPQLWKNEEADHASALKRLARRANWWPSLSVYLFVRVAARVRSLCQLRFGNHGFWERDDSSRIISIR